MQQAIEGDTAPGAAGPVRPPVAMLADRIAAALVHHEPGWRLPRATTLARRHNVPITAIDAAIDALSARHLVRRLPDGQVYRASPAECLITLERLPGLGTCIDPMGNSVTLQHRHLALRRPPEDISQVLRLAPGEAVNVIQCLWTVNGDPAALTTTYLPAASQGQVPATLDSALTMGPVTRPPESPLMRTVGMCLQVELPSSSAARRLRLRPGDTVFSVTVSFGGPDGIPSAVATALLRPGFFRLVVQASQDDAP